jgi:hypothetical protein
MTIPALEKLTATASGFNYATWEIVIFISIPVKHPHDGRKRGPKHVGEY